MTDCPVLSSLSCRINSILFSFPTLKLFRVYYTHTTHSPSNPSCLDSRHIWGEGSVGNPDHGDFLVAHPHRETVHNSLTIASHSCFPVSVEICPSRPRHFGPYFRSGCFQPGSGSRTHFRVS